MSKITDFIEYKKYQPDYKDWKEKRETDLCKKTTYIAQNPINNDEFKKDVERAKIVLNAVNIMDEHSQTKAEDMEQVTQGTTEVVNQSATYVSMGFGALGIVFSKGARAAFTEVIGGNFKNIMKLAPAGILFAIPMLLMTALTSFWAARKQVEASRGGRKEAMQGDLAPLAQFAVLDEKQKKEVEKIAKTIQVDKKEAKKAFNASKGLGIVSSIKELFSKRNKLDTNYKPKDIESMVLSEEEVLQAKKDKDLIQNIVEKIDVASQDYAENAELATTTISTLALGGGGLLGVGFKKLLTKLKVPAKKSKVIAMIFGFATAIAGILAATKIEKQASRVGRFKARQELMANPEQLVYVDEEKYKDIQIESPKKQNKNFFSKIIDLFKDNQEYNKYLKENNVQDIQIRKAKNQIKLTQEQEKRAKQLQDNVFNMFNKLDDKSQAYSESTEALGEVASTLISLVTSLPALLLSFSACDMKDIKNMKNKFLKFGFAALSLFSGIVANIFITKEQRNAARVANMQAIKEMDDYRHFAVQTSAKKTSSGSKIPSMQEFMNKFN